MNAVTMHCFKYVVKSDNDLLDAIRDMKTMLYNKEKGKFDIYETMSLMCFAGNEVLTIKNAQDIINENGGINIPNDILVYCKTYGEVTILLMNDLAEQEIEEMLNMMNSINSIMSNPNKVNKITEVVNDLTDEKEEKISHSFEE